MITSWKRQKREHARRQSRLVSRGRLPASEHGRALAAIER
jgi:hypothetical protein